MSTLGNSGTPGSGYWFDDFGNKQFWVSGAFTMPSPGGTITDCNIYVAGDGGSATVIFLIFDGNTGSVLWQSSSFSIGGGSQSIGGQSWHTKSVPNLYVAGGSKIKIGFWTSGHVVWTFEGSGGVTSKSTGGISGATGGGDEYGGAGYGALGAYVDYTTLPAPTLTSASPSAAPAGSSVTLVGTNLLHTSGITCCGVTVTSYTITDDSHITMTVPAGAAGAGNIVVTTPAGSASLAFVAGQLYGDTGTTFASGVLVYADTGTSWVSSGVQVWADDGTSWHQIG